MSTDDQERQCKTSRVDHAILSILTGKSQSATSFECHESLLQHHWSQSDNKQAMETTEHETNDAINWFTGEVIHSSFLKSRDIGCHQIREMENMIIKQNANGTTKTLKKELKSRKTVQPFPGSSQFAHVTVQQTKQPPLKGGSCTPPEQCKNKGWFQF